MVVRRITVRVSDVVFLKGIVEALDGLAQVFAERGGDLTLASPADREAELDALVDDLCREVGAMRVDEPAAATSRTSPEVDTSTKPAT